MAKALERRNSLVSVIIPTIDGREESLAKAIDSVINQTYENIETVVIRNKPANVARNEGIKMSHGRYIGLLDDDDLWKETKIEKQVAEIEKHPNCSLVICWSKDLRFGTVKENKPPPEITRRMLIKSFNLSSSSSYLIRKDCFDKVCFDINLPASQEYDLAIQLSKYGDIRCVQEVLMIQNATVGQISENWKRKIQGHIGIYRKYHEEFSVAEYIKTVGLLAMFFLGYVFGTRIYRILTPLKKMYENVSD